MSHEKFQPTRWWRVTRGKDIWAETSSEVDARSRMEPGDVLWQLYDRRETKWVQCDLEVKVVDS